MIIATGPVGLTPEQLRVKPANEGRRAAARRRRLDKAAALLAEHGWRLVMPDGRTWYEPGDAK